MRPEELGGGVTRATLAIAGFRYGLALTTALFFAAETIVGTFELVIASDF